MSRDLIRMSDEEIHAFLQEQRTLQIATMRSPKRLSTYSGMTGLPVLSRQVKDIVNYGESRLKVGQSSAMTTKLSGVLARSSGNVTMAP